MKSGTYPRAQQGVLGCVAKGHGWDAPGRTLRAAADAAVAFAGEVVGEVPSLDGTRVPPHRFAPEVASPGASEAIAAMPLWAGESVGGVTGVQPAAEIVRELAGVAERLLRRWGDLDNRLTG